VFEMVASGLREVTNPSEAFTGSARRQAPGSVVTACMEGSRPLLVEVQALVAPSTPGSARRTALGVDHGRVAMLAAVMERRLGLAMVAQDIFVNTLGGVRVDDPHMERVREHLGASDIGGSGEQRDVTGLARDPLPAGRDRRIGPAARQRRHRLVVAAATGAAARAGEPPVPCRPIAS